MDRGGSPGEDLPMALGGITSYSHQTVPHYPQALSSTSLHCAHILLLLFLFHISTIYLLTFVLLSISGCLASSRELPMELYALFILCVPTLATG